MKTNEFPELEIARKEADDQLAGFDPAFKIAALVVVGAILYVGASSLFNRVMSIIGYFG